MKINKFDRFRYWLIVKIARGDMIKINSVSFAGDAAFPAHGKKGFVSGNIAYENYPPSGTEQRSVTLLQGNRYVEDIDAIRRGPWHDLSRSNRGENR